MRNKRVCDYIAEAIQNEILSGRMSSGVPLRQEELADSLGYSRIPIREALQILESQGLAKRLATRHVVVADFSDEVITEIYELLSDVEIKLLKGMLQSGICLMGINIDRVISMTFALGSALAAAGGVLVGIYYNSIDPLMGMVPGIKAFVAAVLGGIGIIPGAMLGGIILGVVEAMVSGFFSSTFRDAAAFAILILILLYKPAGILGKNVREKV